MSSSFQTAFSRVRTALLLVAQQYDYVSRLQASGENTTFAEERLAVLKEELKAANECFALEYPPEAQELRSASPGAD